MQKFRKLPVGIQDFEKLRNGNYLYVDKTEFVYQLVETGTVYFLSRPRRFGKSLLVSTLKAFFEGKKELFKGLKIEELESDNPDAWKTYPVIYLNFAQNNFSEKGALEECINRQLEKYEKEYNIVKQFDDKLNHIRFAGRFMDIVQAAHEQTGMQAVVLIDEYDKALLDSQNDDELVEYNRNILKGLYITLKALDPDLKFTFLTGVTKFSKVSIFSDLNHLEDISMTENFANICGITKTEMLENFDPEINTLAEKNELSKDDCIARLEKMYDGYHFFENSEGVYNPFSLINCLKSSEFDYYWFSTGTSTFLIKKIQAIHMRYMDLSDGVEATKQQIKDYRNDNPDPVPLFYQTGYLTIKNYDPRRRTYLLGYPNEEVKIGFLESLMDNVFPKIERNSGLDILSFDDDIRKGDVESVMTRFESLFASLPYPTVSVEKAAFVTEQNFQNVVYLVFTLLGQWSEVEVHSNKGRADCVLENEDSVYVFEFKVDDSAENALKQIEDSGYTVPYKAGGKKIVKVGACFSSKERTLTEWKIL